MTDQQFKPLGFPIASWAFALRIWLATIVALYVSFWLQLEAPASAMLTVAILAEPTRGQALEKAAFRIIATIIGVVASIVITGVFSQTRDLLLLALAAWIGFCVYVSGLFDGNRAYAGVLSGYTVAFLAVQQLDDPGHVFESSMARGAAIFIGVISITIVNDLLLAPDRHPRLLAQLSDIHRRVRQHASTALRGEAVEGVVSARLLGEVAALRSEVAGLAVESSDGHARSAAAHNAATALVTEIHALRMLKVHPAIKDTTTRRTITNTLHEIDRAISSEKLPGRVETEGHEFSSLGWVLRGLLKRDRQVRLNLSLLRHGDHPPWHWRALMPRSHGNAVESGIRATIWFLIGSVFFVYAGWSSAETSLSLFGVVIGLGAITPNPRMTTAMAMVASPIAGLSAGIFEFFVLDGVADFPLLAIALVPVIFGTSLLMTTSNPRLVSLGRLTLVFVPSIMGPSNPQTYDPESYLYSFLFVCVATGLLFAVQCLVPPLSNGRRARRLLASASRELDRVTTEQSEPNRPEEAMFRDAVLIGQLMAIGGGNQDVASIRNLLFHFDRSSIIRLCDDELRVLAESRSVEVAAAARAALVREDPESLRETSRVLQETYPADRTVVELCSALDAASDLLATAPAGGAKVAEAAE